MSQYIPVEKPRKDTTNPFSTGLVYNNFKVCVDDQDLQSVYDQIDCVP